MTIPGSSTGSAANTEVDPTQGLYVPVTNLNYIPEGMGIPQGFVPDTPADDRVLNRIKDALVTQGEVAGPDAIDDAIQVLQDRRDTLEEAKTTASETAYGTNNTQAVEPVGQTVSPGVDGSHNPSDATDTTQPTDQAPTTETPTDTTVPSNETPTATDTTPTTDTSPTEAPATTTPTDVPATPTTETKEPVVSPTEPSPEPAPTPSENPTVPQETPSTKLF